MEELRVPKRRVNVEVLLPSGAVRNVVVFVAELASGHSGPERVSDLLNAAEDFLPALDLANDQMTFLGRHTIAAARVAREHEPSEEHTIATEHEVEVELASGEKLRGLVVYVLPPEMRLLDALNDRMPFVRLIEKDSVALVNKRYIVRIAPIGGR